MSNLVLKSFTRHLVKHPWQLGLAVLGIMVGVAVIVAIQLTRHSAFDAFDTATRSTIGDASHRISDAQGWISHAKISALMRSFPTVPMTPVLALRGVLEEHENRAIELLGIEPISRASLATNRSQNIVRFNPHELISTPASAVVNRITADELGLQSGAEVQVKFGSKIVKLKILEIVPSADRAGGIVNDLLVIDIATAQEISNFHKGVDHINLRIDDPEVVNEIARFVAQRFEGRVGLTDLAAQASNVKRMTSAFYSNLTALSLMALLVGMFLIYNTETFLVLQRRAVIGRLRSLGVSRSQLLRAILLEAAGIGLIGSVCGIAFGIVLANGLLRIVSTTVNDLYFKTEINNLSLDSITLIASLCIGVAATLAAALIPALDATRTEPNLVINATGLQRHSINRICLAGVGVCIVGNLTAWLILRFAQTPNAGFAGICLVVVAFAALCPIVVIALSASIGNLIRSGAMLPERLGLRTVRVTLNRTGTATAALMIATAASIGIGIMVTSFRASVTQWLDTALRADLYIADGQFDNQFRDKKIPPLVIEKLAQLPQIVATSTVLRRKINHANDSIHVSAFNLNSIAKRGFNFRSGSAATIWPRWEIEDVVLVTEPYAYHNNISINDTLVLATDNGVHSFLVIGVYLDYASERGSVSLSRATYDRHWNTAGYDGIGIYGAASISAEALIEAVNTSLGKDTSLIVNSTTKLKQTSLAIFDRTFLITDLLRVIAVTVSFIGVLGALLAQQLERTQEYGVLRALGFSSREMNRTVLTQTILLGATAALIAIPVGILIGIILIDVVNPRSFGWTMSLQIPLLLVIKSCAIALFAALLAGLYPSFRAARIEPADAMRYE
jgi:putative ABC transport system permease protein